MGKIYKLDENQIQKIVAESLKQIVNERDYYDLAKRNEPEDDDKYREWLNRKAAAKKRYYDSQRNNQEEKPTDYYDYKNGEHPVTKCS